MQDGARLTHLLQSAALEEEDARGRATGIKALDLNPGLPHKKKKRKSGEGRSKSEQKTVVIGVVSAALHNVVHVFQLFAVGIKVEVAGNRWQVTHPPKVSLEAPLASE